MLFEPAAIPLEVEPLHRGSRDHLAALIEDIAVRPAAMGAARIIVGRTCPHAPLRRFRSNEERRDALDAASVTLMDSQGSAAAIRPSQMACLRRPPVVDRARNCLIDELRE